MYKSSTIKNNINNINHTNFYKCTKALVHHLHGPVPGHSTWKAGGWGQAQGHWLQTPSQQAQGHTAETHHKAQGASWVNRGLGKFLEPRFPRVG